MSNVGWHFKKRHKSDEVADPIQGEFFHEAGEPDQRRRPAASLVREAIQNSLDAQASSEPVHVRIYLSDETGLPAEHARTWFHDLWPHLRAKRSGLRQVDPQPTACRFLVVEDFGTRGLEGDPERGQTPDEGDRDDFFAFFRANGLSGKTGQEGGRWGVGKSVFNRASRINTFLAFSVRENDRRALLIGRCFLLTHKRGDDEYHPYGRHGNILEDDFVLPIEDTSIIEQFRHDFRVAREVDTPGLSVVVPYYDAEITADAVLSAVTSEYFYPILTGRLTVQVSGHGVAGGGIQLTVESILEQLGTSGRHGLEGVVELAEWAQGVSHEQRHMLNAPDRSAAPAWSDELFPEREVMESLADQFLRFEPLALRVPLHVRRSGGGRHRTYFDVYLRRERDGRGYPPVFVRSGIIIPKALQRRVRGHDLHAMVVIEDNALAEMLGDAETPAHTHWSPDTRNFKDKYEHGGPTIDFVRKAPSQIAEMLSRVQGERDWLALADFFPRPPEDDGLPEDDKGGTGKRGKKTEKPPVPIIERKPQPFQIEDVPGGFRVVRDNCEETQRPPMLRIRAAYDTARGSPLRRYHPADFDISRRPVRLDVTSAEVLEAEANSLLVRLLDDGFRIMVTGFDENRDVYVKVDPVQDDAVAIEPQVDAAETSEPSS